MQAPKRTKRPDVCTSAETDNGTIIRLAEAAGSDKAVIEIEGVGGRSLDWYDDPMQAHRDYSILAEGATPIPRDNFTQ